jgi:hypothetical protein
MHSGEVIHELKFAETAMAIHCSDEGRQNRLKEDKKPTTELTSKNMQTAKRTRDGTSRRSFIRLGGGAIVAAVCPQVVAGSSSDNSAKLILPEDIEVKTGGSRMIEIDGGNRVWTKKVGDGAAKVSAASWRPRRGPHWL